MKKLFFLLLFLLLTSNTSLFSQIIETRSPFDPLIPEEKNNKHNKDETPSIHKEEPSFKLKGVIWGENIVPQAIIGGKVYKTGDKIEGTSAVIKGIKKNKVSVLFDKRIIILKVK